MILAAGLGTRLLPLTENRPKPLVPVGNRPIIDHTIYWLKAHGAEDIIVNAHYHLDQMRRHFEGGRPFGLKVHISEEPEILGTGGGIQKTKWFWGRDPFIVVNGDILADIDLKAAYRAHLKNGNLVTLVLHDSAPFNQIRINRQKDILDINPVPQPGRLAFTGIHIINPEVLDNIPADRPSCILETYRALIQDGRPIRAHVVKNPYWRDAGTIESYIQANREALSGAPYLVARNARVHQHAQLKDWAILGDNISVESGAGITRSIIWENVTIKKGVQIVDSILATPGEVTADRVGFVG